MVTDMAEASQAHGAAVEIRDLTFAWEAGSALLSIGQFQVASGEKVFLKGASGSGKSTLLGILSGVLVPGSGQVCVVGQDLGALNSGRRDAFRADHLGVIFQLFNLLPYLSVIDNVLLPCEFSSRRRDKARTSKGGPEQEAQRLLERLGLGSEAIHASSVGTLSVGQQQRVAAARALIGGPDLIIADEPTSALDAEARDAFLDLLIGECERHGSALLFVSHDGSLAHHFDRTADMAQLNAASVNLTGPGRAP